VNSSFTISPYYECHEQVNLYIVIGTTAVWHCVMFEGQSRLLGISVGKNREKKQGCRLWSLFWWCTGKSKIKTLSQANKPFWSLLQCDCSNHSQHHRPTYSRVSPVLTTWHPDDSCGLPPHIVWDVPLIRIYSWQAGVSGFGCHRLERPASPRRICAATRRFQTTT